MAEIKTKKTDADPHAFIASIEDPQRREDCTAIMNLFEEVTGSKPEVWGDGIIGFGEYKYKSGKNVNDWFLAGFAPRKAALTLYLMAFGHYPDLVARLGKLKTAGGCLYVKSLKDIDMSVLREIATRSTDEMRKRSL